MLLRAEEESVEWERVRFGLFFESVVLVAVVFGDLMGEADAMTTRLDPILQREKVRLMG